MIHKEIREDQRIYFILPRAVRWRLVIIILKLILTYHSFRRKLLWGGAAVGGAVLLSRLVDNHLNRVREAQGKEALEQIRFVNVTMLYLAR